MSARFRMVAKLGFIGTAWMFSTPVAMLDTSTRSPPIWRAMSARSGIVATTLIFESAGASAAGPSRATVSNAVMKRFIGVLLAVFIDSPVPEAVDVAAEDDRPLQEELVLVESRLLEARVLETQALELRQPQRQVRRVRVRRPDDVVDVLRVVEEEARVVALAEARLEIGVQTRRIAA